jgi:hypothetical protein
MRLSAHRTLRVRIEIPDVRPLRILKQMVAMLMAMDARISGGRAGSPGVRAGSLAERPATAIPLLRFL